MFSPRGADGLWDVRDQPPNSEPLRRLAAARRASARTPDSALDGNDMWAYTKREGIPIIRSICARWQTLPLLGDADITFPIQIERRHHR